MRNKALTDMVTIAIISGIIIAMTFIPYVGYIQYGIISITTLHIPVALGIAFFGLKGGTILGSVWGITCFLNAFIINPIEGAIFLNPLISIVPRILVGIIVGAMYQYIFTKIKNKTIGYALTGLFTSLVNTILVLFAIGQFGGTSIAPITDTIKNIYGILISVNGIIEMAAAVILVPVICIAAAKVKK